MAPQTEERLAGVIAALVEANRRRAVQYEFKSRLRSTSTTAALELVAEQVTAPDTDIGGVTLYKALLAVPRIGPKAANRVLRATGLEQGDRLREVAERQVLAGIAAGRIRELAESWRRAA